MRILARLTIVLGISAPLVSGQSEPGDLIYSGEYVNGAFESLTFVNSVVGWDTLFNSGFRGGSTVIGNIEAGNIWFGHEAFTRAPDATTGFHTYTDPASGSLNETDFHATMVGHVLAGSGYTDDGGSGTYSYVGLGMAPEATLVSGSVAVEYSDTDFGSFSTTTNSVVSTYRAFFQGTGLGAGVSKPDVINSSWGGGDAAAVSTESLAIDGLALQNSSVALVVSAGNGGNAVVSAPASGFNNIAVGSLGGASFLEPSDFSSQGMSDFYNPTEAGGTLHSGVRVAVSLAAPGERLVLAAYLGDSGSIGTHPDYAGTVVEPPPTDQYFLNTDGTSFSAPLVAGGIALLKDVAKTDPIWNHNSNPDAFDTRVVKSVLMAGAQKTVGWDNGQNEFNVTTQALDMRTGAGAMDLDAAVGVYFFGTRDLAGDLGGEITTSGWDSATIDLGSVLEYRFATEFTEEMALNVALNWFSDREFDDVSGTGSDVAFANLNLQVWQLDGTGDFTAMVGESATTYNNSEFLRFDALGAGQYGLRVLFEDMVFDTTNSVNEEFFGLAWNAVVVPEPGAAVMLFGAALVLLRRRRC